MSKADEMFEKLGYKKEIVPSEISEEITHMYIKPFVIEYHSGFIDFRLKAKKINITHSIETKELQAINEKCKELGWLDE